MRDISTKPISLRTARAIASLYCSRETYAKIKEDKLPKGPAAFETAKAAAFLGAKKTPQLIPHCHPIAIESLEVNFSTHQEAELFWVEIEGKACCHGRTGIEMEALTAVFVAALVLYDLLKPLKDPQLHIGNVRLLEKTGGTNT